MQSPYYHGILSRDSAEKMVKAKTMEIIDNGKEAADKIEKQAKKIEKKEME